MRPRPTSRSTVAAVIGALALTLAACGNASSDATGATSTTAAPAATANNGPGERAPGDGGPGSSGTAGHSGHPGGPGSSGPGSGGPGQTTSTSGGSAGGSATGSAGGSASAGNVGAGVKAAGSGDACPTANFPDLSNATGAGNGYEKPRVTVTCTDSQMTVQTNDMPSYPFVQKTPNALSAKSFTWSVPRQPTTAASPTSIRNVLGTLGFSVTGLAIYGPTEGAMPADEAFGDPVHNGLLDTCGGHTGPGQEYHLHTVVYELAACNLQSSQIVGYALDGFPIYNSVLCMDAACSSKQIAQSGYKVTGDPSSQVWNAVSYAGGSGAGTAGSNVLDECNGRVEADGTYAYHVTPTQFPYIIGCFRGTATTQTGNAAAPMPPMNGTGSMPPMNGGMQGQGQSQSQGQGQSRGQGQSQGRAPGQGPQGMPPMGPPPMGQSPGSRQG